MAKFTNASVRSVAESYQKGQDWMEDVEVDIPRENQVDPLLLVRTVNGPKNVDSLMPLVIELTKGQTITFTKHGKVVHTVAMGFTPNVSVLFAGHPEYLELLVNVAYGIMLKKLTPLSGGSPMQGGSPEAETRESKHRSNEPQ